MLPLYPLSRILGQSGVSASPRPWACGGAGSGEGVCASCLFWSVTYAVSASPAIPSHRRWGGTAGCTGGRPRRGGASLRPTFCYDRQAAALQPGTMGIWLIREFPNAGDCSAWSWRTRAFVVIARRRAEAQRARRTAGESSGDRSRGAFGALLNRRIRLDDAGVARELVSHGTCRAIHR